MNEYFTLISQKLTRFPARLTTDNKFLQRLFSIQLKTISFQTLEPLQRKDGMPLSVMIDLLSIDLFLL